MKFCECGGEFLRHGKTAYKDTSIIGVRYICRDCRKSHTERFEADPVKGFVYFNPTGRPTLKDWRHETLAA